MNCRQGDLARTVAPYFISCSCGHRQAVVKIDTFIVCGPARADGWSLEQPLRISGVMACDGGMFAGTVHSLPDAILRPIRDPGHDATDEIVQLVGVAECYAAIRCPGERADDEAMANARLFSTAQELLSLLQDAVESFGPHIEGGDDEWLTFARAAIAKATGSTT